MPTDADAPDIVWGIKDHDPTIATLPEHKLLRRRLSLKDMSEAVFTEVEKHYFKLRIPWNGSTWSPW